MIINEANNIQNKLIPITKSEFSQIREYVYSTIGIHLTDQKVNLVNGRLQKILKKYGNSSFSEYYQTLKNDSSGKLLSELADTISTNHTFFWREHEHFDFFTEKLLPELIRKKKAESSNDIRLWCAGCSTGEEPYILVILMMEYLGYDYANWQAGILATDISSKALDIASKGVYHPDRLNLLPKKLKNKYFNKTKSGEYEIIPEVKKEVVFRRFNLMNEVFPFKKNFDSIFCRNVMIYFDEATKVELVNKFYNKIEQNSYFFIGHAETINRKESKFNYIQPALYRK